MQTYTYKLPFSKGSTKTIQIFNAKNEPVFSMKRTYKSIFHQIFDSWFGKLQFFCEYEGRNQNGEVIVQSKKKHFLTKNSYSILTMIPESKSYCAQDEGWDVFTPTYDIKGPNELKVTIDFNKFVQFYENGSVIAKLQLQFLNFEESVLEINELASIQNPLFYAIFAQKFYFIGDY